MTQNLAAILSAQQPPLIQIGPKKSERGQRLSRQLLASALSQRATGPWSTIGGLAQALVGKIGENRATEEAEARSDALMNALGTYRDGFGDQPAPVPGAAEAPHPGLAATEPLDPYQAPGTLGAFIAGAEANPAALQHEQFGALARLIAGLAPPPAGAPWAPEEAGLAGAAIDGEPIAAMTADRLHALAALEPATLKARFSVPQLRALAARWDQLGLE